MSIFYRYSVIFWLSLFGSAQATDLSISPVPLYLGGSVEPNIMFTLDDSGSMQWEIMPDENLYFASYLFPIPPGLYGGVDYLNQIPNFDDDNIHNFFSRSSQNNAVFYDPDVEYVPWSNADGTSKGDASPTAALYNPDIPGLGSLNLTTQQTEYACWFTHTTALTSAFGDPCNGNHTYWPITYYTYNSGAVTARASYTQVQITSSTAASTNFTSPNGTMRTRDEEIQNFANWFQYYRSRILTARAGVGRAFAKQSENMRVGFAAINEGASTIDGVASDSALVQGLRPFSGTDRTNFFNNLYGRVINNFGTPLRNSLDDVGKYFERTDDQGPWSETPGTTSTADHLSCRQSYNISMTDGFWNGGNPSVGDIDGNTGPTISGPDDPDFTYTPEAPYRDGPADGSDSWSDTLADVAMHYWNRDLRSDSAMVNDVPTNSLDPAFWQHLVNFTVGLGVDGTLDPVTDWPGIQAGTTLWPDPSASSPAKIDDLWHAAVNSRGQFFSAADPDTFSDSLSAILSSISDRTSSASAVALNSGTVSANSKLYQARFDSGDWTGQLLAFEINLNGSVGNQLWDAADLIPAANTRTIITFDGTDGQPFQWSDISSSQQTLIGSETILNYLRGDQSNEESNSGGTLRNRNSLLGDIVHSSPFFVGPPNARYPDNWGSGAAENTELYSDFISNNSTRQDMVYVGSNDGMLHAFNADTGIEEFAYVPNVVFENLADLADPNYNHKYYVDSKAIVIDAFFDGEWHSVLVSSLRGGGQGVFAIDVTDLSDFAGENTAASKVLWEFTDADDEDLGYVFSAPNIVRLHNGKWAAVFSGGYNNTFDNDATNNDSSDGDAVLFIVDIEDGSLIKKFDTKTGAAEDPTGNNRPNGLSALSIVDVDGDKIVDAIYAGDLFGNVWKMDISGNSAGSWKFEYKQGNTPLPIYTACAAATCTTTNHQPITTQIQVTHHPKLTGYMLLFGTGQYFEVGDNSATGQTTQTFYGIWDKDESSLESFDRDDLLQQQITEELVEFNAELRVTTDNTISWDTDSTNGHFGWYLDLINTEGGNTDNFGERQVSNSIVRNGSITFVTLLPDEDPCAFGGSGWTMFLDVNSGSRLPFSPIDLNGDRSFTADDFVNSGTTPISGIKSQGGIPGGTPGIISLGGNNGGENAQGGFNSNSDGGIEEHLLNPGPAYEGRQSWRQLDF